MIYKTDSIHYKIYKGSNIKTFLNKEGGILGKEGKKGGFKGKVIFSQDTPFPLLSFALEFCVSACLNSEHT